MGNAIDGATKENGVALFIVAGVISQWPALAAGSQQMGLSFYSR
jgi:hypothetical protein